MCSLRVACNTRRKNGSTGEWEDKPNYFNITVWGAQGENAARYLVKGRPVAIDGRLEWREWEAQDGSKRQAVDIIADSVQFLGSRDDAVQQAAGSPGHAGSRAGRYPSRRATSSPHRSPGPPATTTFPSSHTDTPEKIIPSPTTTTPRRPRRAPACRWADTREAAEMAKARGRGKPVRRRDRRGGPGSGRRKPCQFCRDKVEQVDYKDVGSLRRFISEKGKIRSRRITGSCRRHQVQIARAVKRARELALLPYVNEGGRDDNPRAAAAATATTARHGPLVPQAILLQDVESLGDQGTVVEVSKGYLRNYLIPRKLAQPATKGAVETVRQRQAAEERAAREAIERAQDNVNLLNRTVLTIPQQAGADGRLFGSVTAQDIAVRDPRSPWAADRQTQRPPPRADQERRHLHGRRGGRRRGDRHAQDHGRRQELTPPRAHARLRPVRDRNEHRFVVLEFCSR